MRKPYFLLFAFALAACGQSSEPAGDDSAAEPAAEPAAESTAAPPAAQSASERLDEILVNQPAAVQDRYVYRHPRETLEFFGIEPGMTVAEALPGGGWYSKILIPYLGSEGELIGADYAVDMYKNFDFADAEFLESRETWVSDWPATALEWQDGDEADVSAFVLGALPEDMHGTADAALFIRALHNLARFDADGNYLTQALTDAYNVLKPGGTLGVVQHAARADMPDDWATGGAGYLKQQFVIDRAAAAGFEFVDSSDVNANPKDQPTVEDIVWRLPPSLRTTEPDTPEQDALIAVGESNRMTLKFRKPAM